MRDELLTVRQAAEALSLSIHTIRAWIADRKIGYVKLGKAVRVKRSEIDRVLTAGSVEAIDHDRWARFAAEHLIGAAVPAVLEPVRTGAECFSGASLARLVCTEPGCTQTATSNVHYCYAHGRQRSLAR